MLFALLTALVVTLAACGGGSSSTGGGGGGTSGSTVAGTVNDGVASVYPAGQDQPIFLALADMLVEPAQAAPVEGVPVTLTCTPSDTEASPYSATDTTGADGRFLFEGVPAGQCELQVYNDTIVLDVSGDSNTAAQVSGNGGTAVQVEVTVQVAPNTVSGEIEDDASSDDDDSSGDGASEDDDSSDDASVDDDSVDDDRNGDSDSNDDGDSDANTA